MYLEHFGLNEAPFRITAHPDFFFEGANRNATLDALLYAITSGEGIVKVTGEVGTGKSMLCRVLMEKLPEYVDIVYLANPSLSKSEILYAIADELKIDSKGLRQNALVRTLQDALLDKHAHNRQVVLLVDEAHAMPLDTLEEIRLLSNLESKHHKLLQIVLFGQPELNENLNRHDMRPLKERIAHSFVISPLALPDVGSYIMFRMRAAGYRGPDNFTKDAIALLGRASKGLSRRVNILTDKSLLAAFADGAHTIDIKHVKAAIKDSEFADLELPKQRWKKTAIIGGILGTVLTGGAVAWWSIQTPNTPAPATAKKPSSPAPTTVSAPATAVTNTTTPVASPAPDNTLLKMQEPAVVVVPPPPPAAPTPAPAAPAPAPMPTSKPAPPLVPATPSITPLVPAKTKPIPEKTPEKPVAEKPAPEKAITEAKTNKPTATDTKIEKEKPEPAKPATKTPPVALKERLKNGHQWVKTQQADSFTIQVNAPLATDTAYINQFLGKLQQIPDSKPAHLYLKNTEPRRIGIVYGSYASAADAEAAMRALPEELRSKGPFIRKMKVLRTELAKEENVTDSKPTTATNE